MLDANLLSILMENLMTDQILWTPKTSLKPLILVLFFLTFPLSLFHIYGNDAENCTTPYFAIQGEYFYLRPSIDNDYIASPIINAQFPFNLQPAGPGKKNKFDYTSGYRLSAFYFNPNFGRLVQNGGLSVTYLQADHSKEIDLHSHFSDLQPEVFVRSDQYINYISTDLFITYPIFQLYCLNFSIQPGLHYAVVSFKSHVRSSISDDLSSAVVTLKEKSCTWGCGPEFGFNLNYQFNDKFFFVGKLKGGLLISNATAHLNLDSLETSEDLNSSSLNIDDPHELWKIFPFWETDVGFTVSLMWESYAMEIEIGYKYLTYPNFINRIQFPGIHSSNKPDNLFTNVDFRGPYASFTIDF